MTSNGKLLNLRQRRHVVNSINKITSIPDIKITTTDEITTTHHPSDVPLTTTTRKRRRRRRNKSERSTSSTTTLLLPKIDVRDPIRMPKIDVRDPIRMPFDLTIGRIPKFPPLTDHLKAKDRNMKILEENDETTETKESSLSPSSPASPATSTPLFFPKPSSHQLLPESPSPAYSSSSVKLSVKASKEFRKILTEMCCEM